MWQAKKMPKDVMMWVTLPHHCATFESLWKLDNTIFAILEMT
jgi:hypothetical protein